MELDEIAWQILQRCDGHHDMEAIVRAMMDRYAGDPDTIRNDVQEFLMEMRRHGLLEFRTPSDPGRFASNAG